ncbi:fasciclin domain-containing protein [Sphingobacterium suaedae]|uniref:Fasciclin domain-containing protein n=1 Tax=Sphingobacterium suaedae TaxID=1686402 RepID=A0ABW5KIG6_9SPHI
MMKTKTIQYFIWLCLACALVSCKDKWADHLGDGDAFDQKTLYDVVTSDANFSAFTELLEQSGYAEALKASKNYTLIIPNNAAIATAKMQYDFADSAVVRSFVGYHLINSIYNVHEGTDTVRALNFRNKYVEFTRGELDGIVPISQNLIASNGLYHVVNQALEPLQNIFTLVNSQFSETAQVEAINSFDTLYTEDDLIYFKSSPVWIAEVRRNMTMENKKFTYFVVDDENFDSEYAKLQPFFATPYEEGNTHRPDSTTTFFTKKALLRDFIVEGALDESDLIGELQSISGTRFHLDPANIISSHKASNGIVYRVKRIEYALADQIKEIKVVGTQPIGYKQNDKRGNIFFRDKRDVNGLPYTDIQIYDHKVTAFYAKYRVAGMNVVKYKVYGRAIMGLAGDPQTATFTQYVHFFDRTLTSVNEPDLYKKPVINSEGNNDTRMAYEVQPLNHEEVYLGEITQDQFGNQLLLVMSNGTGPIILEYLRFVPIVQ